MQEICGDNGVSSSYVSQSTSQLDELFEKWRTRQLPPIAHLFLDATYSKVRLNGVIVDCAVFVAVGIDAETGRRMVLGVSVERSEEAAHWTTFIQSLLMRGMNRPLTVTSDDHTGIRAALARTLTGVLWQRCQFHLQQNAQSYVTNSRYKTIAAAHIRSIFNAGSRKMANIMLTNTSWLHSALTVRTNSLIGLQTTSKNALQSLIALRKCKNASERQMSWKASIANSSAEQTSSPSSHLKILYSEL